LLARTLQQAGYATGMAGKWRQRVAARRIASTVRIGWHRNRFWVI